jgi:hypothetical protein
MKRITVRISSCAASGSCAVKPALVDITSPRFGIKASYYSVICLETGKVLAMPVEGNTNAETSVAFLQLLRGKYNEPLIVIWDNGTALRGEAMRTYLSTPVLKLRLVALPSYSPNFTLTMTSGIGFGRKLLPTLGLAPPSKSARKWIPFFSDWQPGRLR